MDSDSSDEEDFIDMWKDVVMRLKRRLKDKDMLLIMSSPRSYKGTVLDGHILLKTDSICCYIRVGIKLSKEKPGSLVVMKKNVTMLHLQEPSCTATGQSPPAGTTTRASTR